MGAIGTQRAAAASRAKTAQGKGRTRIRIRGVLRFEEEMSPIKATVILAHS